MMAKLSEEQLEEITKLSKELAIECPNPDADDYFEIIMAVVEKLQSGK